MSTKAPNATSTVLHALRAGVSVAAVTCTLAVPATSSAAFRISKKDTVCAATKRVVNGGRPMPWALGLFSVLRSSKYTAPVLPRTKFDACSKDPLRPGGTSPGALDFHRSWKIRDPLHPHGQWLRIIPGRRGIMLTVSGWLEIYTQRCVYAAGRFPITFSGFRYAGPSNFYGLATDDVTSITASGGTGQRKGANGELLPVEVTVEPKHNVFHLDAPNGATQLTFNRAGKPPVTVHFGGDIDDGPVSGCRSVAEEEGWHIPTPIPPRDVIARAGAWVQRSP